MGHFPFMNIGSYPFTNLDNVNLDWFIDDAFRMKEFVKREVEDIYRMKEWVLRNMVKVDVIAELVKAVAIKAEDKNKIKENLDIKEGGKIDAIKVNGNPVDVINKTAEITLPEPPTIPVTDVKVNGSTVVQNKVANINIPEPPTIPVTDVKVNGTTVLQNKVANISIPEPPTIPVTDVRVNGQTTVENKVANVNTCTKVSIAGNYSTLQANGEIKFTSLDVGLILDSGSYIGKQDSIKHKLNIPVTADDYRTACNIITVEGVEF